MNNIEKLLVRALVNAKFNQAIILHQNADVMDCEHIEGTDKFIFDTTAMLAETSIVKIHNHDILFANHTAIRMTVATDGKMASSVKLDEEFLELVSFDDLHWSIYKKDQDGSIQSKSDKVILNGQVWAKMDMDLKSNPAIKKINPLHSTIIDTETDVLNEQLDKLKDVIFNNLETQNFGNLI